jgi:uncharacterized membrane protein YeaQ/YmgE (transglycosylase-associated protein family)
VSLRSQGTTLFTAILILVGTGVVVQLWLLTLSTEALLSGQSRTLIAAAIGSTVLLLINSGLLRYVYRVDRDVEDE